ncbi:hypothetical protein [Streptomyces sp. NPDC005970]|uniref:hypothetical protein n=1 Tax=Streptomyces sp. NPDC005970 TaxID=3156723 RepID=UPI0033FE3735
MTAPTLFDQPARPVPASVAGAGPAPLVIALDIALGTTGVAGTGWTDTIRTGTRRTEDRLDHIVKAAASFYRHADYVAIEGPSYGSALQNGHDEMAAARWMIRHDLWKRGIPYAIVPPDNRTIYATGKARWKHPETGRKLSSAEVKGLVRTAVQERYGIPCEGPGRYDQADAYVILSMFLDQLGHALAEVPPTHSRALAGCQWPDLGTVAR